MARLTTTKGVLGSNPEVRHTKIHDFNRAEVFVEDKNILWLDVAVYEVLAVHKLQRRRHLSGHQLDLLLAQTSLRRNRIEEVAERCVLLREDVRAFRLERYVVRVYDGPVRRQVVAEVELAQKVFQL